MKNRLKVELIWDFYFYFVFIIIIVIITITIVQLACLNGSG